jgi:hypothetical protein
VGVLHAEGERAEDAEDEQRCEPDGGPRRSQRCTAGARISGGAIDGCRIETGARERRRDGGRCAGHDDERRHDRQVEPPQCAGQQARPDDGRRERSLRAHDDGAIRCALRGSGRGVDRHVGRARRCADHGERKRQNHEVPGGGGDEQTSAAEQREQHRGRPQPAAVDGAAAERHRRQRTGADEQQRDAELPLGHAGLVAERRDRRAPGAPERAEDREAGVRHPRPHGSAAHLCNDTHDACSDHVGRRG